MKPTLETKLAAMLQHMMQVRRRVREEDTVGLDSYFNDPEILEWVDKMDKEGRMGTTRFTTR